MFSRVLRHRGSVVDPDRSERELPKHNKSSGLKGMFSISSRVKLLLFFVILVSFVLLIAKTFRAEEWHPSPPYSGPSEAFMDDGAERHGFLPLEQAQDCCHRRRWEPYRTRNQRRKVYDLFLINTELDFLEIRLNELNKEVDYFVVLESPTTFQRNAKPLHLKENLRLPQFKDFQHKIIHRILDIEGAKKIPQDDTWDYERFNRYVSILSFHVRICQAFLFPWYQLMTSSRDLQLWNLVCECKPSIVQNDRLLSILGADYVHSCLLMLHHPVAPPCDQTPNAELFLF